MTPQDITAVLSSLFGNAVQSVSSEAWQVEVNHLRLLVLLSEDQSWLRALVTIAPLQEAQPYLAQILEANFDETQEVRYAIHQGLLWAVFQHNFESLIPADFRIALIRLITLQEKGLHDSFDRLAETQIRQIIRAAKQQGQSLEGTLQTLERFYREGVMGDVDLQAEQRDQVLGAWRYQLERLWNEE